MILIPGTTHVITWSKQNLADTTTYYVRAVIRDVRTNSTLATVNLTSLGGDRYSGNWKVVGDPTGNGREVEIEKTVYEDAAYTVVSGIYGRWLDQYSVFALNNRNNTGGFGGSGQSVDYKRIEQMIASAIASIPPAPPVNLDAVMGNLGEVKKTLGERLREIFNLAQKADSLEETEKRAIDVVKEFITVVTKLTGELKQEISDSKDEIKGFVSQARDVHTSFLDTLTAKTDTDLEHIISTFTKVLSQAGSEIGDKLASEISTQLAKPLKVQAVQDMHVVRDQGVAPKEPAQQGDPRVKNLLSFTQ